MNELLAQAYGTDQLIEESMEKTAESQLLDELVKVAEEEGINLDDFTDEEIVQILSEALEDEDEEEEEEGEEGEDDSDQEKLGEADFLGRTMAHAFYNELHSIGDAVEKTASGEYDEDDVDDEAFEEAALERANEMIMNAAGELEDYEKTASAEGYDVDLGGIASALHDEREENVAAQVFEFIYEKEKTSADEELDDALTLRALQLIDESDYDVNTVVDLLINADEDE